MEFLRRNWLGVIIVVIILVILFEQEPKTITEIKYIPKTETITETKIDTVYKKVYFEKTKTLKGKDSIIYKDVPSETASPARQYKATVKTDSSRADLQIVTTGELIDVKGTISYNQKETTKTIVKQKSGLFIYGSTNPTLTQPEIGLLYQLKNKVFISTGVQYNSFTKTADFKIGVGIKIL